MKIIDVTLRESIYIKNNAISLENSKIIVKNLADVGVDYIEIGYVSLSNQVNNSVQEYCPLDYVRAMKESLPKNSKSKIAVMISLNEYNSKLKDYLIDLDIDLVRICIKYEDLDLSIRVISELQGNGFEIAANLVRFTELTTEQILYFYNNVTKMNIHYVYLADSNGSAIPKQIQEIFKLIPKKSKVQLGYHPHNNLGLALMNSLNALENGVSIIDSSIYGYGKGFSNLSTEVFVCTLSKLNIRKFSDSNKLLNFSINCYELFIKNVISEFYITKENSLIVGYKNINISKKNKIEQLARSKNLTLSEALLNFKN